MVKTRLFCFLFFVFNYISVFCSVFQLEMQQQTQQTIYGLHTGKEYEVHIHCRMPAFKDFGDFSESIFIQVTKVPNKGKVIMVEKSAICLNAVNKYVSLQLLCSG